MSAPPKPTQDIAKNCLSKKPPSPETLPEVFIIESLDVDDEMEGNFEGLRLSDTLRLAGNMPKYFYIHEEKELELLVPLFVQSKYRYLHLSCHGSSDGFNLQRGFVSFERFAEIFRGALILRRVFVSSCSTGERSLVDALHKTSKGIHSVIAPCVAIKFSHASVIWASLYVSLLERNGGVVQHKDIISRMQGLVELFPYVDSETKERMNFMFAGYDSSKDAGRSTNPDAWKIQEIQSGSKSTSKKKRHRKPKKTSSIRTKGVPKQRAHGK